MDKTFVEIVRESLCARLLFPFLTTDKSLLEFTQIEKNCDFKLDFQDVGE